MRRAIANEHAPYAAAIHRQVCNVKGNLFALRSAVIERDWAAASLLLTRLGRVSGHQSPHLDFDFLLRSRFHMPNLSSPSGAATLKPAVMPKYPS